MVDDQPLVICSGSMTYLTISQGQVLRDDLETDKRKDCIETVENNSTASLWNNTFIECLVATHSSKPRMMS